MHRSSSFLFGTGKNMQQEAKLRTTIVAAFLALLICSCSVHSCNLARSPSPAPSPAVGIPTPNEPSTSGINKKRRGSFPATCYSKCDECEPCMPVKVSVRSMATALEENEYYPQVWKCACGDNIFSP